ncbi:MAG: integrin alpha [Planctomycetota bacterium]|nr:integrin alpha [Planctomycetota bacterium]
MFRWLVLVFALLLGGSGVFGRSSVGYTRYKLHELVLGADAIALGRIVALDEHKFEVVITRQISGVTLADRVVMYRFVNWTCARRWAPYAIDQELVLFLRRSYNGKHWRRLGAGCEGEMPLLGSEVGLSGFFVNDVPLEQVAIGTRDVSLQRVPLADLEAGIRFLREHFEYSGWTQKDGPSLVPHVSMERIEEFARTSTLAAQLIEDAFASEAWKGPVPDDGPRLAQDVALRIQFPVGETSEVEHPVVLGDLDGDGVPEALATVSDPNCLALVRRSPEGTTSFTPIQVENFGAISRFGACAPLGDLDSDGELDFALNVREVGLVLLSLGKDRTTARWRDLAEPATVREAGFKSSTVTFSDGLAPLGDLDGDGTLELAVLVERKPDADIFSSSLVFVLSIDRMGAVVRALRWNDSTLPERGPLRLSLTTIGDVDGDGVTDVALGDSYGDPIDRQRGALWIVFLARDGSARESRKFDPRSCGLRHRFIARERFAKCLAPAGDLDGDSIPDLFASSETGLWTLLLARDGSVRTLRRLLNPELVDPAHADSSFAAPAPVKLGDALASLPARPGRPATLICGAFLRSTRRTGLLAFSCGPDGTLTLR